MERFVGKMAVVTGVSRGIGKAIAKELAIKGVNVVGIARNMQKLKTLSDEINENSNIYNGKFYDFQCDISKEKEIKETFAKIKEKFGIFSILVNNAGVVVVPLNDPSKTKGIDFDTTFDTNTKGSFLCALEAINSMSANVIDGHIININSIAGLPEFGLSTGSLYKASKTAFRVLAKDLRREMIKKKLNIKITNIYPGAVITDMLISCIGETTIQGESLSTSEVARVCISVLDTPPNVLISDVVLEPIFQKNF